MPERVKHFIWRVRHNVVASKTNVYKKRISRSNMCPIREVEDETLEHIFLLCPWTTPIWFSLETCSVPTRENTSNMAAWLDNFLDPSNLNYPRAHNHYATVFQSLWEIWKGRNSKIFVDKDPRPMDTLFKVKLCLQESNLPKPNYSPIPQSPYIPQRPRSRGFWRPPRPNIIKFNSDVHFDVSTSRGVSGVVCRDENGKLIIGTTSRITTFFALVAEAFALREAISLALNLSCSRILLESDCLTLIEACRGNIVRNEI